MKKVGEECLEKETIVCIQDETNQPIRVRFVQNKHGINAYDSKKRYFYSSWAIYETCVIDEKQIEYVLAPINVDCWDPSYAIPHEWCISVYSMFPPLHPIEKQSLAFFEQMRDDFQQHCQQVAHFYPL